LSKRQPTELQAEPGTNGVTIQFLHRRSQNDE
jgi:hypothetical protein